MDDTDRQTDRRMGFNAWCSLRIIRLESEKERAFAYHAFGAKLKYLCHDVMRWDERFCAIVKARVADDVVRSSAAVAIATLISVSSSPRQPHHQRWHCFDSDEKTEDTQQMERLDVDTEFHICIGQQWLLRSSVRLTHCYHSWLLTLQLTVQFCCDNGSINTISPRTQRGAVCRTLASFRTSVSVVAIDRPYNNRLTAARLPRSITFYVRCRLLMHV